MAKYEIEHACGHVETVQIYGPNSHGERECKVEWLESQLCDDCKREREQEENDAWERKNGLTSKMEGSEKQVAWARTIRRKACEANWETMKSASPEEIANLAAKPAKWWIDNRYDLGI